ncbi:MAG TPA: hypothetical protein PKG54_19715 [Phycisphaerae bacterium]|jgi:hypothetical protein|nr:hypothetical protein [Phycisphaerae bacterium]HOB76745.1 hypothetical protein [Phycisphaerae bacterium]HOJ56792.1 hypothetical protein [Phycisphaerae bacterium]HOL28528.1 hypothetical protein [Phycisphaerae bacterium]HPP23053.1 hypothetical protein [Phycisphaerae bacterium]
MIRRKWQSAGMAAMVMVAVFSTGCDDMVRRSVRDGVFSYISGGLSRAFDREGAVTGLLNDLLTGGLFAGTGTNTPTPTN